MDEQEIVKCRKCGNPVNPADKYCRECGAIIIRAELIEGKHRFSIKHAVYSALITLLFIMIFSFITGFAYTIYDQEMFMKPERLIAISIIGPVTGIFLAAVFTSYKFILITINETFYGASAVILMFKTADFIIAKSFSIGGVGSAAASCAIALAGAWIGNKVKRKIKFSN